MIISVLGLLAMYAAVRSGILGYWQYPAFLPLSIVYFMMGILSRFVIADTELTTSGGEKLLVLLLLTVTFSGTLEAIVWIAFMACVMDEIGIIRFGNGFTKKLSGWFVVNPYVARLGTWSYSTYLIHIPIFVAIVGGYSMIAGELSQDVAALLVLASLPLVFFVSWLSFTMIEKPFNFIGRRLAGRMSTGNMPQSTPPKAEVSEIKSEM